MKRILFPVLAAGMLLLGGCSSKQYFEPEQTYSVNGAQSSYEGKIVDKSRDGATLEDGRYIGKSGVSTQVLPKGFRFLSENGSFVLAANESGDLKVIRKKTGKTIRTIALQIPVVSAAIRNGLVAYILNNNAFGLYSISKDKKLIENRSERTYAIDTRAASPMFIDSLVVMPMLDGKLVIFDVNDPENAKVVYLSSDKVFNNIIYLSRMGDTLVAATPKKLLTLGAEGEYEYRVNIAEVSLNGKSIYVFSKEGEIIKLNVLLEEQAKKKFKFAQFAAATALKDRVVALDIKGSLIVLNRTLSKYRIYDVGEVDSPVYIAGNKLYKDGTIIHLDKLDFK